MGVEGRGAFWPGFKVPWGPPGMHRSKAARISAEATLSARSQKHGGKKPELEEPVMTSRCPGGYRGNFQLAIHSPQALVWALAVA